MNPRQKPDSNFFNVIQFTDQHKYNCVALFAMRIYSSLVPTLSCACLYLIDSASSLVQYFCVYSS